MIERLRWGAQRPGERVLRVWLGATFTYAGVQKLADPGFFTKGSPTYIGSQLDGFAHGSPIAALLHVAGHAPVLTGVAVAVTEILIGIATLAGIGPSVAAVVGFLLSVSLWLSASWHVHPYFLGSDSIYAVAWLAYALSLPGVVAVIADLRGRRRSDVATDDTRRTALRGAAVVAGALAIAAVAGLVGRGRSSGSTTATTPTPPSSAGASAAASPGASSSASGAVIAQVSTLDAQGGVDFTDPTQGDSVVCALSGGAVAAFSRQCTHAGCTTSYDPSSKLIVCPCHGSRFDPAAGGKPVNGPATQPLASIPVQVDGSVVRLST